ncbi:hypothetical protein ACFV0T_26510 [Streptomyces sp. NPDC059582]|uniref:hypothetical protein n=1 Tax=Streptomyces sp. NPDC059582 TaxID=3346875 RepID=UPI0036B0130B
MTIQTVAPAISPFARDPFYALGIADAYDEHAAGETLDTLKARANALLDADYPQTDRIQPAELYRLGYVTSIAGLINSHIATVDAQSELAQKKQARKQGRDTSTRHTSNRRTAHTAAGHR